jgi:hypothetical protein
MDQFLGRYRGHRIFGVEYVEGEASEEFRVEGLGPRFLSLTQAQRAVDGVLAELEGTMPAPAPTRVPTTDESRGIAWWSDLSEADREAWLQRAGSALPADAWAAFKAQAR